MSSLLNQSSLKERLGGRNLYLVGMMGSGKSVSGSALAKAMQYGFVDIDQVVEKTVGKSISRIFSEDGETNFREVESQVLNEIGKHHSLVVATGGGIVVNSENWGILHQGVVIWLDPGKERLIERLQLDSGQRPLLKNTPIDLVVEDLLKKRQPYYSEADLHICIKNENPDDVSKLILNQLYDIIQKSDSEIQGE